LKCPIWGIRPIVSIPISYDASAPVIDKEPTVSNYFVKVSKDNSFAKTTCPFSFPLVPFMDFDMNFDVKDEILYLHDETTRFTPVYNYHRRQ
jgi:hypothetical protein